MDNYEPTEEEAKQYSKDCKELEKKLIPIVNGYNAMIVVRVLTEIIKCAIKTSYKFPKEGYLDLIKYFQQERDKL